MSRRRAKPYFVKCRCEDGWRLTFHSYEWPRLKRGDKAVPAAGFYAGERVTVVGRSWTYRGYTYEVVRP